MSDTTLGTLILFSPIVVIILLWPRTRRMLMTPVRGLVRLLGFILAVVGIAIVGGEPKRQLIASLKSDDEREHTPRRARHAKPEPEYLDTAPADVPAPVRARPGLEPYSPDWYDVIYDMQD